MPSRPISLALLTSMALGASTAHAGPSAPLSEIPAADCQAVCDRIQQHCGLDSWTDPQSPLYCFMLCESGKDGDATTFARTACVASASDCTKVAACVAQGALLDAWMVIVAGSTDPAQAQKMLEAYQTGGGFAHGAFPQLLDSGTVEGLNPGFTIVVAATPSDKAVAIGVRDHIRSLRLPGLDTQGTYIRAVRVAEPEGSQVALPGSWRAIVIWQTTTDTSEDWAFFTNDVSRAAQAAGIDIVWAGESAKVPIVRDGTTLTTLDLGGQTHAPIGYLFSRSGHDPEFHEHSMPHDVLSAASAYFGVELTAD